LARLGWFPSQANLPLHGFQNTKPTWFLLAKLVATYNFATSPFCTTESPFGTNLDDGVW